MTRSVLGGGSVLDPMAGEVRVADIAIEEGSVPGPRLLISLAQLCGTGGIGDHFSPATGDDTSFLGSATRPDAEHQQNADDEIAEIVAEAARHDVPVMAHAHGARAAESAARAMALDAGIPMAMGTDCPVVPHPRRLEELGLMHRLGMDAAGVWRTSTSDAARLLDRSDLGALEPGRRADVVAVEGDPWSFDGLDSRVRQVWKDGVRVR